MKKNKWLTLGMSAILSLGLLAACGTSEEEPAEETPETPAENAEEAPTEEAGGTIVMGTSADYPPFESVDVTTGEYVGFDIELAELITEELGYELEIMNMDFNGLIAALESERVDFVMSAMSATDDRRENVDFSNTYYEAANLIVVPEGSGIASIEDLIGKSVGVQLGSIQEETAADLQEELGELTIETRDRIPDLIQELLAGRLDALIIEDKVAEGYVAAQDGLTSFEMGVDEESGFAIAFPKGSELVEPFNEKLNELIENGTVDELIVKWLDTDE
ncbi:transporter substrate-binding domain-containing protein [Halalkalibacterium ligniniphilum]|uniref:transporter substrate-binding domain-containing protein n=1 Tax=Halalkalibacterium ligniniphilum TaxID=1134413 RepID=UPI000349F50E|nr:transporter substrate-binding domain-containing protein [Halalkalibacterium ligniniphilum]